MATSSIFTNFTIKDSKSINKFANALETFEKTTNQSSQCNSRSVTDLEEIKLLMKKNGNKK